MTLPRDKKDLEHETHNYAVQTATPNTVSKGNQIFANIVTMTMPMLGMLLYV